MKSFSNNERLTSYDIGQYIKNHGALLDVEEPCIYVPAIENDNYLYFEKELNNPDRLRTPFVCGVTQKDMEYLPNSIFVFVNDDRTNAIATNIGLTPIIGIYTGSISDTEYNANQMIGSLFEGAGFLSSLFKHKIIRINSDGILTVTSDESLLGYKDERILSHMVSACALRFLVLHEIGHHVKGHISDLERVSNFVLLKATDNINSKYEREADAFAAAKLADEYELILSEYKRHIKDLKTSNLKELELLTLKTIVLGVALTYTMLYQPDKIIAKNDIESTIAYREIITANLMYSELYNKKQCKDAVFWDVCHLGRDDLDYVPTDINVEQIKKDGSINLEAFFVYLSEFYVNCKLLYYKTYKKTGVNYYYENYLKVLSYIKGE